MAWIHAEPDADVEAVAVVPARCEDVFAFLADLENHWRLTGRFVEVIDLSGAPGRPADGGRVRIRGPLGLRRTAATRVAAVRAPRLIIGTAELPSGTRARVSWSLAGHLDSTRVRLAAGLERAGVLDRALLALGGRWWLRRQFASTLERLAAAMAASGGGAEGGAQQAALTEAFTDL